MRVSTCNTQDHELTALNASEWTVSESCVQAGGTETLESSKVYIIALIYYMVVLWLFRELTLILYVHERSKSSLYLTMGYNCDVILILNEGQSSL